MSKEKKHLFARKNFYSHDQVISTKILTSTRCKYQTQILKTFVQLLTDIRTLTDIRANLWVILLSDYMKTEKSIILPLMPGVNKKVTYTLTNLPLKAV